MKCNETKDLRSVEKWCNEICGRGKREKPREKPVQTLFRLPRNSHGVTETRIRDPSGGRRAFNRLHHEAAFDQLVVNLMKKMGNKIVNTQFDSIGRNRKQIT